MKTRTLLLTSLILMAFVTIWSCSNNEIDPDPEVNAMSRDSLNVSRYSRGWVHYAQVTKNGNYFRRMFIDSGSAAVVSNTAEIPNEALFAMETWFGHEQSTVFIRQRNSQWQSGSFSPGNPSYSVATQNSCNSCHSRAASTDFTFTKPLLVKALQKRQVQFVQCNQDSFNPCDLSVYLGN